MSADKPIGRGAPHSHNLAHSLERLLATPAGTSRLTANQLLERTEGRGLYLVFIVLSLPFVAWFSIPGLSVVVGIIIMLLAWRLVRGRTPRLPDVLGDRPLSPRLRQTALGSGLKFCRLLQKLIRPRRRRWLGGRGVFLLNVQLIILMAFLLALPLPAPPFFGTNALPSYAIILLALAMMEEDGVMLWIGYLASLITVAYFLLLTGLIVMFITSWWEALWRWLGVAS
jgi:hypothetical protein